jgi:hypothetical protein
MQSRRVITKQVPRQPFDYDAERRAGAVLKRKYLQPLGVPLSKRSVPTKLTLKNIDNEKVIQLAATQAVPKTSSSGPPPRR